MTFKRKPTGVQVQLTAYEGYMYVAVVMKLCPSMARGVIFLCCYFSNYAFKKESNRSLEIYTGTSLFVCFQSKQNRSTFRIRFPCSLRSIHVDRSIDLGGHRLSRLV